MNLPDLWGTERDEVCRDLHLLLLLLLVGARSMSFTLVTGVGGLKCGGRNNRATRSTSTS